MQTRPVGVTVMSLLAWLSVPWMALLLTLSLVNRPALEAVFRGLSPGGSGPAEVHLGMGRLLPIYCAGMAAAMAALARGLWRQRNWARLAMIGIVGLSFAGLLASVPKLVAGSEGWALFLLRVGLCAAAGGYLFSRPVREAFRRRETEDVGREAGAASRLADRGLVLAGVLLLAAGPYAGPLVAGFGWLALVLAFFAWVAEADGIPLPRPGRLAIRTAGCWETPFAFTVRHRDRVFFLARADLPDGGWADEYTVRQRSDDADARWALPIADTDGWSVCGRSPVGLLGFEHHGRVSYVRRRSLERALATAGA
jgi:hypothetical protein